MVAVRDWHIEPGEFWMMTIEEWYWLYNGTRPAGPKPLSEEDYADCLAVLEGG